LGQSADQRTFLSFWELLDAGALTWHNQFTDKPEDARAYSERRLFGERCRRTFYGVLQNPMLAASDPVLRSMYGQVCVTLKPDVLDAASFTLADSQSNAWALPYDAQTVKTMLFAWFVGQREPYMARLLPTQEPMRYIEVQIHRPLTRADVYAVDEENSYAQEMSLHAPIPA
jgi:hypothetical protein